MLICFLNYQYEYVTLYTLDSALTVVVATIGGKRTDGIWYSTTYLPLRREERAHNAEQRKAYSDANQASTKRGRSRPRSLVLRLGRREQVGPTRQHRRLHQGVGEGPHLDDEVRRSSLLQSLDPPIRRNGHERHVAGFGCLPSFRLCTSAARLGDLVAARAARVG